MARSNRVLAGPRRPLDLILVCAVVAVAALLPVYFPSSPLSWIFGFAAVFFCPGYAIVAASCPAAGRSWPSPSCSVGRSGYSISPCWNAPPWQLD